MEELIEHWLRLLLERYGILDAVFDDAARACLLNYSWPGNVRELRNAIECAVLMSRDGAITVNELPLEVRACPAVHGDVPAISTRGVESTQQKVRSLEMVEAEAIRKAIQQSEGNLTQAAAQLGIAKSTLYLKMNRYSLKREP